MREWTKKGIWVCGRAAEAVRGRGAALALAGAAALIGLSLAARGQRSALVEPVGMETHQPAQAAIAGENRFDAPRAEPTPCPPSPGGEILAGHSPDALAWWDALGQYAAHRGVDIGAPLGSSVLAALDGTVSAVYDDPLLGRVIELTHPNGETTRYANLTGLRLVEVGQAVRAGDAIDSVGQSALSEAGMESHLHLEYEVAGESRDPMELLNP